MASETKRIIAWQDLLTCPRDNFTESATAPVAPIARCGFTLHSEFSDLSP
jgi:hypothetical protein